MFLLVLLGGLKIIMNKKEYSALLYMNDSADGKPVTLNTEKYTLKIKSDLENISLPISGLEFKLGGEESRFLIAKSKNTTLFIEDPSIFDELIANSSQYQIENLTRLKVQSNKKRQGRKLLPLYVLGASAAIIFLIFISFHLFTDIIARGIPVSWEKKIGDAGLASMIRGKTIKEPELVKPVEELGKYLQSKSNNSTYDFKFYVIKDNQVNAFALPGGNVVVYTGLLEHSDSPEEVAGILAHEIEHVYQKHGMKRIVKRFGISIFLSLMFGSIGNQLDAIGGDLASLKFDRDEESEADRLGLELLYNAGIDPQGMVSFFKRLKERDKDLPEILSFLSTHPSNETRIEDLQNLIKTKYNKLPYKKEFNFDWKRVKAIAKEN